MSSNPKDDEAELSRLAAMRRNAAANPTARLNPADPTYEDRLGYRGENAFRRAFGFPLDDKPRPHGDGGRDHIVFWNGKRITIDVKTTETPNLMVKEHMMRRCADILFLYHWDKKTETLSSVGWAWRADMKDARLKSYKSHPHLPAVYERPVENTRPAYEFIDFMGECAREKAD